MTAVPRARDLHSLLRAVNDARTELERHRTGPDQGGRAAVTTAQQKFRHALEAYAAAAATHGLPLPHRLRVELNMYRCLDQNR
jgi:hypothetical protein